MGLIDTLKKKREELLAANERRKHLYEENSVYQFYEESLQFANSTNGRVVLITPDTLLTGDAPKGISHKKVCETLLGNQFNRNVNLDSVEGDYGHFIASEFNTIFIRMVSIINNVSVLYYPSNITEYQLKELKKFKEQLDEYNALHKKHEAAEIVFMDSNGNESKDLDGLIESLEKGEKFHK